jgi:hypothetical protein
MAFTGASKRQKELSRLERRKEKEQSRQNRKAEKAQRPTPEDGVDPDIAHIVPGPQPLPEE